MSAVEEKGLNNPSNNNESESSSVTASSSDSEGEVHRINDTDLKSPTPRGEIVGAAPEADEDDVTPPAGPKFEIEEHKSVKGVFTYADNLDMLMIIIGGIFSAIVGFGLPIFFTYVGKIYDSVAESSMSTLFNLVKLQLAIGGIVFVLLTCSTYLICLASSRQEKRVKVLFLRQILSLDMGFYDSSEQSSLFTQLQNTIYNFKMGTGVKFCQLIMMLSMFVAGIAVGFWKSWELTLVLMAPLPLMALGSAFMMKVIAEGTEKETKAFEKAGGVAEEAFNTIRTVVSLGAEGHFLTKFMKIATDVEKASLRSRLIAAMLLGSFLGLFFMIYALGFWYACRMIRKDIIRPCCVYSYLPDDMMESFEQCRAFVAAGNPLGDCSGFADMFAFAEFPDSTTWATYEFTSECAEAVCFTGGTALSVFFSVVFGAMGVGQAGPNFGALGKAAGAVASARSLIDTPKTLDPLVPRTEDDMQFKGGDIELKNMEFVYPSRPQHKIFSNLNLCIKEGQSTALVGASGCGKSTIIQLILRYYSALSGQIEFGGTEVSKFHIQDLRDNIAIVSQEPRLFSLSIMENIRLGKPGSTDEECIRAAMMSNAHMFISKFAEGYHTYVGSGGNQLSGGQKQRVCIARALLRNPKILILDEATSALDNESERIVQATLDKLLENSSRTTIIIAHRLSTIRSADNIVVLRRPDDNGAVVHESGTHDSLMGIEGEYSKLVKRQQIEMSSIDLSKVKVSVAVDETEVTNALTTYQSRTAEESAENLSNKQARKLEKEKQKEEKAVAKAKSVPQKRVWKDNMGGYGGLLTAGVVFAALNGFVFPGFAIIQSYFIGVFYLFDPEEIRTEAGIWSLAFVGLAILVLVALTGQTYYFGRINLSLQTRIRNKVFDECLHQDIGYFDREDVNAGTITAMLSKDAQAIGGTMSENTGIIVQNVSSIVIALVVTFIISWKLALGGLASFLLIAVAGSMEMALATNDDKSGSSVGTSGFIFNEILTNVKTVASFNLQEYFMDRFNTVNEKESNSSQQVAITKGVAFGFSQFGQYAGQALAFFIGGKLLESGDIETITQFNMGIFTLMMAAMGIGFSSVNMTDMTQGRASLIRVYDVIDRDNPIDVRRKPNDANVPDGGVKLDKVQFSYPSRPTVAVYNGVDINIKSGTSTALVGASGCGKSTVIQLMQRFYDVACRKPIENAIEDFEIESAADDAIPTDPGAVLFNALLQNIKDLNVADVRSAIGIVSQEPSLFDTTILENIRLGCPTATDAECEEAAKSSNAYDFVMSLPDGFNSEVGSFGSQLSGGQKQRICIARALVKAPKILLLDEATSALDNESEAIVQEALDRLMKKNKGQMTIVVVAHRLSTIRDSDNIVVFKPGEYGSSVAEQGTHDSLYNSKGVYFELVNAGQR